VDYIEIMIHKLVAEENIYVYIPSFEECKGSVDVNKMHDKLVLAVQIVVEP
jgi:hypothetical protein